MTDAPPPRRPAPDDEGLHAPGPEELWNESYYFDGVSDDLSLGVYARFGRLPNRDECVYSACVCGPGRPTVMLVGTENIEFKQQCERPLELFTLTVAGEGEVFEDPSAVLRGEGGPPSQVQLALRFETDGVPYSWSRATRYEIPCRVTGTVRVGAEKIEFAGPGQRDHSWGHRDWWASDWMWSALHFEDGTHTHAVGVPQVPGFGVGYVQRGGELAEITAVEATEAVASNGLITEARIVSNPGGLDIAIEPLAFGPVLLTAPDGRIAHFPRAMCRARTTDGRTGSGWVEWNRNQR